MSADLNNAVVWMVPTRPHISKTASPRTYPLVTIASTQITISITFPFMFQSVFSSLARSRYLSLFTVCIYLSFLPFVFWKSQRILCVSISWTDSGLCICYLFVWSNLNFLHSSQWITFLIQSCPILYSLCINLLRPLIMWMIVSSLSPHTLHLLFCCVLSILALT